jgi:hypothetical protein
VNEARIIVDPTTVHRGRSGATGNICVALGTLVFPDPNWNDFVVVILDAWAAALVRILNGTSEFERVHFMEGPYAVDIEVPSTGELRLRAIDRGQGEREKAVVDTPLTGFIDSLTSSATSVLAACRQEGSWSNEADNLAAVVSRLRSVSAGIA